MCENNNSLVGWCKEQGREDILKEWDIEKNRVELGLEIDEVSKGNHKKVWWLCKEGHSYQKKILQMVKSQSCPICRKEKRN